MLSCSFLFIHLSVFGGIEGRVLNPWFPDMMYRSLELSVASRVPVPRPPRRAMLTASLYTPPPPPPRRDHEDLPLPWTPPQLVGLV